MGLRALVIEDELLGFMMSILTTFAGTLFDMVSRSQDCRFLASKSPSCVLFEMDQSSCLRVTWKSADAKGRGKLEGQNLELP